VRDLELERFGYRVDAKDPPSFPRSRIGTHLFMWQDRARLWLKSPSFPSAMPRLIQNTKRISSVSPWSPRSLLLTTPPNFPPAGVGDFIDYLKLLGSLRGLSKTEIVGLVKIFTQSASELLDEWFESEQLKVTLATDGVIGANGGPRSPGTAYILLHQLHGRRQRHRGLWGFVRGGMGTVSNAIADSARSRGVVIRTSAPVEKILVARTGRALGVVLEDGEEVRASIIASNLDPPPHVSSADGPARPAPGFPGRHPQVPL